MREQQRRGRMRGPPPQQMCRQWQWRWRRSSSRLAYRREQLQLPSQALPPENAHAAHAACLRPDPRLLAVDQAVGVAQDVHPLLGPRQQDVGAVLQPHKANLVVPAAARKSGSDGCLWAGGSCTSRPSAAQQRGGPASAPIGADQGQDDDAVLLALQEPQQSGQRSTLSGPSGSGLGSHPAIPGAAPHCTPKLCSTPGSCRWWPAAPRPSCSPPGRWLHA